MKVLARPGLETLEVFDETVKSISTGDLQNRFLRSRTEVSCSALQLELRSPDGWASTLSPTTLQHVSVDEMDTHYASRLARESCAARKFYDLIQVNADRRCCYCSKRPALTLDHYLPKRPNTALAVTPINLIPACDACNRRKGSLLFTVGDLTFIQPYIEGQLVDDWLGVDIRDVRGGPVFEFFVDPPPSWSVRDARRVAAEFDFFGLAELYATESANEVTAIKDELSHYLSLHDETYIAEHLRVRAQSMTRSVDGKWLSALYRAMAESVWFCRGAFMR